MKYLFKGKYGALGAAIVVASLLSGCGENPLKSMSQEEQIEVLTQANYEAMNDIKNKTSDFHSGFYKDCVRGRENEKFCKKYYKIMVKKLKPVIGSVSASDITDEDVANAVTGYIATRTYLKYEAENVSNKSLSKN